MKKHRHDNQRVTVHTHSQFHLLPFPFPLPYSLTFATQHESITADYWKYAIAGFFGELFVPVCARRQK